VGAGTDATRVASFNPFIVLYWLVSGKTAGGLTLYDESNRISREEALHLYTAGKVNGENRDICQAEPHSVALFSVRVHIGYVDG
jgi:predicted amidohydrolase YtcJ